MARSRSAISARDEAPSNEALIRMAYGLVMGPEGYEDLFDALQTHQADIVEKRFTELETASDRTDLDGIAAHFENALEMLQSQGRRKLSASSAIRTLDASIKPALTLSTNGGVMHANPAACSFFGLSDPAQLTADHFEPGHYKTLLGHLSGLKSQPENTIIAILGLYSVDDGGLVKMSLSRTTGWKGEPVGLLSALHISWYPDIGRRFQDMMGLTPAELQITRAIVTGLPLSSVAEARGSKLSTVRNQTKALLKKMGVRSQTELACLYSGFSRFSLETAETKEGPFSASTPATLVAVKPGHVIDHRMAGAPRGKPVIYLPSMLGGRAVTRDLHAALLRHDIKLVMPWRPGFAQSYNAVPGPDAFVDRAEEIRTLMDTLSIDRAPVVGQMTSTMYAFGAATHLPDRITGVMAVTPALPSVRGPHLRHIGRAQKVRLLLARETPRVGRLIAHAFLSRVDAGYDVEFIRHYLSESQTDLDFTRRPETVNAFRETYEDTHGQGYDAFINEVQLISTDWHALTQGLDVPVRFFVGTEEHAFPPPAVEAFAEAQRADGMDATSVTVPRAGHLLAYEEPDLWVAELARMVA